MQLSKRHKLRENKTISPALHIPQTEQKKKGFSRFFKAKRPAAPMPEPPEPEPIFLREIDLGHTETGHSKKVEHELALWLNDGRIVRSLEELAKSLRTMNGRVFMQHRENNDIAEWVRDVVGDRKLAEKLSAAPSKTSFIKILGKDRKISEKLSQGKGAEVEIAEAIEKIAAPKRETMPKPALLGQRYTEPKLELPQFTGKEKITRLIEQARKAIDMHEMEEARRLLKELKTSSGRESKKIKYDVMELETDLKMAMLV